MSVGMMEDEKSHAKQKASYLQLKASCDEPLRNQVKLQPVLRLVVEVKSMEIEEIERKITANEITAAMVFTLMKQHLYKRQKLLERVVEMDIEEFAYLDPDEFYEQNQI